MNLQEYIDTKKVKKVPAEIIKRWQERVIVGNLQNMPGRAGATSYLGLYGTSIAAPKCLALAQQAMNCGYPEMAAGFYMKAASLEGVVLEGGIEIKVGPLVAQAVAEECRMIAEFPTDMQPGKFSPMQPVDGLKTREYYINNLGYWGQPKIDGNKLIVFATPNEVYYQSRQMKLNGAPCAEIDAALREEAEGFGPFVLEGELTYLDLKGKEHRTGPQALTANSDAGNSAPPQQMYYVFSCLWHTGTNLPTQKERIERGRIIAQRIAKPSGYKIAYLPTARTTEEKAHLCATQKELEHEGEVWFRVGLPLYAGKRADDGYVRTKYLNEFDAMVTALTTTTGQGHAFGAMTITSLDGKPLGSVGTGFTMEDKREIKHRFSQGPLKVKICSQGFTEGGCAWHARFIEIINE